jgi:hypothetical protein
MSHSSLSMLKSSPGFPPEAFRPGGERWKVFSESEPNEGIMAETSLPKQAGSTDDPEECTRPITVLTWQKSRLSSCRVCALVQVLSGGEESWFLATVLH